MIGPAVIIRECNWFTDCIELISKVTGRYDCTSYRSRVEFQLSNVYVSRGSYARSSE